LFGEKYGASSGMVGGGGGVLLRELCGVGRHVTRDRRVGLLHLRETLRAERRQRRRIEALAGRRPVGLMRRHDAICATSRRGCVRGPSTRTEAVEAHEREMKEYRSGRSERGCTDIE